MHQQDGFRDQITIAFERERPRIVGLCAHLSGERSIAEDLAQETFTEAWRHIERLETIDGARPWLSAIARNVCRRWRTRRGVEIKHLPPVDEIGNTQSQALDHLSSGDSVEIDIERDALADLLDQALTLLPATTRRALLARYIEESPYAVIAAQLQMSEGAVKMRVKRGKITLARVLQVDLQHEADAILPVAESASMRWRSTPLWCSVCGRHLLEGRFDPIAGDLQLRCPACYPTLGLHEAQTAGTPAVFRHAETIAEAYQQLIDHAGSYLWDGLRHGSASCTHCGRDAVVEHRLPNTGPLRNYDRRGVTVRCDGCGHYSWASLNGLLLSLPDIRQFRLDHPRIQILPEQRIEAAGQPALAIRLESHVENQQATAVVARDSLQVLTVDIGAA